MTLAGVLDVYFTVDVEVWCDGWVEMDRRFPEAYRRYVHGPTARGDFGLPFKAKVLQDHGLTGTFFVEPLFSTRFGAQPLNDIVGILSESRQDIQLHLHTEWVDEARQPLLRCDEGKKQHLRQFTASDQFVLLDAARRLLEASGAPAVSAFRAGSFAFNADTLPALARAGITIDASYNATMFGPDSGVSPGQPLTDTTMAGEVLELPMTVFHDGFGRLRHVQLTACSWPEMEALLWQALHRGQRAFVILSHNFELLNTHQTGADDIVIGRFRKLCAFLDRHRDRFHVRGLRGACPKVGTRQPPPLQVSATRSFGRMVEQLYRRRFN